MASLEDCLELIPEKQRYRLNHKVERSDIIAKIASSITNWKYVGNFLPRIDKQDIVAIEHDASVFVNQKTDLLYKWKEKNGHEATYHQLAKSLFEAGAIDSVHTLCQELGAPRNPRVHSAPPLAKKRLALKTSVSSYSIQVHVSEDPSTAQPAAENEVTPRGILSSQNIDTVQEDPSPENEARSSTPSPQITDTESSVPASEPGTVEVDGRDSDKARAQTIAKEAAQLQHMFVTIVTHTMICFKEKKATFLGAFRITLQKLPLSKRFKHLHFLDEKKDSIKKAKDVEDIFDILDPYWNYRDYALLEHVIKEFGTSELKEEMKEYILKLEKFEKNTSVKDYNSTALDKILIPDEFEELAITQSKDPAECSLYDVRQLKNEIVDRSTLTGYAVFLKSTSPSSVKIILAFPPEAHTELLKALDKKFMETHQLQFVFRSRIFSLPGVQPFSVPIGKRRASVHVGELSEHPTLQELERLNIPQHVGANYFKFGEFLLDDKTGSHVKRLEQECLKVPKDTVRKILQEWLEGNGTPVTWGSLTQTLRIISCHGLAYGIDVNRI